MHCPRCAAIDSIDRGERGLHRLPLPLSLAYSAPHARSWIVKARGLLACLIRSARPKEPSSRRRVRRDFGEPFLVQDLPLQLLVQMWCDEIAECKGDLIVFALAVPCAGVR